MCETRLDSGGCLAQPESVPVRLLAPCIASLLLGACLGSQSFDDGEDEVRTHGPSEMLDAGVETVTRAACDPLNLAGRPGLASYALSRHAIGAEERLLALLVGVDGFGQATNATRLFYGQGELVERPILGSETDPGGRFSLRFGLSNGEAVARFGFSYIDAGQSNPTTVMYTPITLELAAEGEPTRVRLDEIVPAPATLDGVVFECLPGSVDVELPAPSTCDEDFRVPYCIEIDGGAEPFSIEALSSDVTITAIGVGAAPDSNCPYFSRNQLGGGPSSDDPRSLAHASWFQGTDEIGRRMTVSISMPAARWPLAVGDVVNVQGSFQPLGFSLAQRHFEVRDTEARLLFWYAEDEREADLPLPAEFTTELGEPVCGGVMCAGGWEQSSLRVSFGADVVLAAPQLPTRVGDGTFVHTGDISVGGPGDGTFCPTDFVFGGILAAYYDDSLSIPDADGVGGPCPHPLVVDEQAVESGELVCLGGLASLSGYLTVRCGSDADCPGASSCDGSWCRARCTNDTGCSPDQRCEGKATDFEGEEFSFCRCGDACFEGRCDVTSCPDACPSGEWVTTFATDPVACLDNDASCPQGYRRFDLAGCGCGCEPIPEEGCPAIPEGAEFEYAPGGCTASCADGELRIETVCGCGCAPDPSCARYNPLDAEGPIYLGAAGECATLCDENTAPVDDDCGCFCHWAANIVELCDVPPDPGPCVEEETRYFRDVYTGRCEEFVYGGCLGNWNNFATPEECRARCGD